MLSGVKFIPRDEVDKVKGENRDDFEEKRKGSGSREENSGRKKKNSRYDNNSDDDLDRIKKRSKKSKKWYLSDEHFSEESSDSESGSDEKSKNKRKGRKHYSSSSSEDDVRRGSAKGDRKKSKEKQGEIDDDFSDDGRDSQSVNKIDISRKKKGLDWMLRPAKNVDSRPTVSVDHEPEKTLAEEMQRKKSLVSNIDKSTASFSSTASDDHESLGADHEQAPEAQVPSLDTGSSSVRPPRRGGVRSEIEAGKYIAQWKPDHSMFTNIEAARMITSAMKSSMEVPLFQWSQVSKNPEWKSTIDAWFRKFKEKFHWDRVDNAVARKVWENHSATRLRDFWYEAQKKAKKYAKERGLPSWEDVAVWRDFRPPHVSKAIWEAYIQHVTSERFVRRSQSGAENRKREIHGSITTHTGGSIPFVSHAKRMAMVLGRKPKPLELFVETHMRNDDRRKGMQQLVDSRAQKFVETYTTRLQDRYGDDPSTHPEFDPDLWLEAGLSGGPDRNRVYGISSTTVKDLRTGRNVSTVGSSQSGLSSQTPEFQAIVQQEVEAQTARLTAETERLSAETAELRRLYMELLSNMSGTCGPPHRPLGPHEDPPSPPSTSIL